MYQTDNEDNNALDWNCCLTIWRQFRNLHQIPVLESSTPDVASAWCNIVFQKPWKVVTWNAPWIRTLAYSNSLIVHKSCQCCMRVWGHPLSSHQQAHASPITTQVAGCAGPNGSKSRGGGGGGPPWYLVISLLLVTWICPRMISPLSLAPGRLHGEPGLWNWVGNFSPGWNSEKHHVIALIFQPGLKSELGHAQRLCFQENKMTVSHFSPQFQISARAETSHVIATKFQPGGGLKFQPGLKFAM